MCKFITWVNTNVTTIKQNTKSLYIYIEGCMVSCISDGNITSYVRGFYFLWACVTFVASCRVFMKSSANDCDVISRKVNFGVICKDRLLLLYMASSCCAKNKMMHVLTCQTVYVATRVLFDVYSPRCFATWEHNTKITPSWPQNQFATELNTSFFIYHCMNTP